MSGHTGDTAASEPRMDDLRLTRLNDPAVLYALDQRGRRVGEVRPHRPHAAVLHIGESAWWLVDDVAHELHRSGASIARRLLSRLLQPRQYSLREAGSERVLAQLRHRWRWSTRQNGIACTIGATPYFLRCTGALSGRFSLEDAAGAACGEVRRGGFGRWFETQGALPFPAAETALLLFAAHRIYGVVHDGGDGGDGE
jgi:hypothetical protein